MKLDLASWHRFDIVDILSSEDRDYLIRNNGDQVKVSSLKGKIVGIYFGEGDMEPDKSCSAMTLNMAEAYNQLSLQNHDFEVVFVATQESNIEMFDRRFSRMPWLAIPFSDFEARARFLMHPGRLRYDCVLIDREGKVLQTYSSYFFQVFGAEWYPFTGERIKEMEREYREAREEQTLQSFLSSPSRDYVISSTKIQVPISELEDKMVGLYLYRRSDYLTETFTSKLKDIYHKLKAQGKSFEIVMISLQFLDDDDNREELYEEEFRHMPWLAVPLGDHTCRKLRYLFPILEFSNRFLIIGPGGNIFDVNGAMIVWRYGAEAYPFTIKSLAEKKMARNLESILANVGVKFVCGKGGIKIQVSSLCKRRILLLFGQNGSSKSHELSQKLLDWHQEGSVNKRGSSHDFEIVYIPMDEEDSSFYNEMSWLTVPFDKPETTSSLMQAIGVYDGVPAVVAFGEDGWMLMKRAITTDLEQDKLYYWLDNMDIIDDSEMYNDLFDDIYQITKADLFMLVGSTYLYPSNPT